ncbi:MAG: hypothetical protein UT34_C0001G0134 [candidate division WS6 bacterium GW2011_GWF2_39_15]|uniref:HTH arsR-type domain-containing protein n=1 Tax=candidate division WS6 bacterium GW2011_GWF2_39_15 TaxID=1619100 RepID=A0A0G0MPZ5_9BACT|nr:MAG: hypothetical protein UT34_C0001G0134 [candidate division WS6 bacterium GW2011_GWF2_39_15]
MTYSQADKYSRMFRVLSDPYALLILDILFETDGEQTPEELASQVKTSESKARGICEELRQLNVLDKDNEDGRDVYEAIDSQYGNFLEAVIEKID